jgi:hypothetical protein
VESICLVLGAGATVANAIHFHPRRMASQNPPLDYTFFERIADLGIPIPAELRWYAEGLPGANPFRPSPGKLP